MRKLIRCGTKLSNRVYGKLEYQKSPNTFCRLSSTCRIWWVEAADLARQPDVILAGSSWAEISR